MKNQSTLTGKTRFNARLSSEEKELFEKAASLAGFRTLTDFVVRTVKVKAEQIIKENDLILASKRDGEIFFNALLSSDAPNTKLQNAANKYIKDKQLEWN